MVIIPLKIYGTARKWHRERWIIAGKPRYVKARRNSEGEVITWEFWSPFDPIEKEKYREIAFEIEAETGREAYRKIVEIYNQFEWVEGTFEVDY